MQVELGAPRLLQTTLPQPLTGVHTLPEPISVQGATGNTQVTQAGKWEVGPIELDTVLVVPDAPQSVAAAKDILKKKLSALRKHCS